MKHQLILASTSPRRQELLKKVDIAFTVRKQDADESTVTETEPREKSRQLAMLKGRNVERLSDQEIILTADTVVSSQGQIFEKPKDAAEARGMLRHLSGNWHEVYTGVMLRSKHEKRIFTEKTSVEFWDLSEKEIEEYISTEEPFDKAGAYGIQGKGAIFAKGIIGDYNNVVGLPVARVARELRSLLGT